MKTFTTILLASLLAYSVKAQTTVTLNPAKDNTLFAESGSKSNGQGYLFAGITNTAKSGNIRRALLQFDLSSIPTDATITSASLTLNVNKASKASAGQTFSLHRLTKDWGEGTSDATGAEGGGATAIAPDATWTDAMLGTSSWTNAGGDYESTASASLAMSSGTGNQTFSSSSGLIADIQAWLDGSSSNFGWILIGEESATSARRFGSKEQGTAPVLSITYEAPLTWTGSSSTDWNTASNWSSGTVPGETDDVIIPDVSGASGNFPVVTGDFSIHDLEIAASASLTVSSGVSFAIMGAVSGTGMGIVEQAMMGGNGTKNSGGYNILSSPFSNATIGSLGSPNLVYTFDGANYVNITSSTSTPLTPGAGYFVAYDKTSPTLSLQGKFNHGSVSYSLSGSSEFHLVGNPYAAAISRTDFLAANSTDHIDGALYFWDDGGSNNGAVRAGVYVSVDAAGNTTNGSFDGNIRSMQGFYVFTGTNNNPTVQFTPAMQQATAGVNSDGGYYRQSSQQVRIAVTDGKIVDELLLNFSTEASFENEAGLDVHKLLNPQLSFYSIFNEEKWAIQALPLEPMVLDLGIEAEPAASLSIKMKTNTTGFPIYLVDQVTQTYHLLADHSFELPSGQHNERFALSIGSSPLQAESDRPITVHAHSNQLKIMADYQGSVGAAVYSLDGKEVVKKNIWFVDSQALMDVRLSKNQLYILKIAGQTIKFLML